MPSVVRFTMNDYSTLHNGGEGLSYNITGRQLTNTGSDTLTITGLKNM